MPPLFGSARRTFSRQPNPVTYLIPSNILMTKASHGNDGVWKAWKAQKPAFHPSHTPWKSLWDSHITTATTATIMYLKTGKARRKPAFKATLTARGL
jgi:hypothetical protein